MEWVKKNAKSIVAFAITAIVQAVSDRTKTGEGLPSTPAEWLTFLGLSLLAAAVVWLTGNKQDAEQVIKATNKLSTEDQVKVAKETLQVLPDKVSDNVVATYPRWNLG